jgi:hypothetical protein
MAEHAGFGGPRYFQRLLPQAQRLQDQQGDFVRRKRTKPDDTYVAFRPLRHHRLCVRLCTQ